MFYMYSRQYTVFPHIQGPAEHFHFWLEQRALLHCSASPIAVLVCLLFKKGEALGPKRPVPGW